MEVIADIGVRDAAQFLEPVDVGDVDFSLAVVHSAIGDDGGPLGVLGADGAFAANHEAVGLIEIRGPAHVGRDHGVVPAHAVNLNCQQYRDVPFAEVPRQLDGSRAAEAQPVDDDSRGPPLAGVEHAVLIAVKRALDQRNGQRPLAVRQSFDMQARDQQRAELEGQLARRPLVVVPAFPAAQESDYQRVVRDDRGWRAEVVPGLGVEGWCENSGQGEGRRETTCWEPRPVHRFIVSRLSRMVWLADDTATNCSPLLEGKLIEKKWCRASTIATRQQALVGCPFPTRDAPGQFSMRTLPPL